jgi:prephenate dehydrogenase
VDRIAVYGLGLLGGSLCRAVKAKNPRAKIYAYNRNRSSLEKAKVSGAIDVMLDECRIPDGGVDLAVVAVPVIVSAGIISSLLDSAQGSEIIIDLGSVKGGVVDSVIMHENAARFVPCHPMAGSEQTGFDASDSMIFNNASVIITPHEKNSRSDVEKVSVFWESLDAHVTLSAPSTHDRIVAFTSHLPHMVASVLAISARKSAGETNLLPFIGKGFRDMTRLAEGSADVWTEIGCMNARDIIDALDCCMNELQRVRGAISRKGDEKELREFLESGTRARKEIIHE